MRYSLILVFVLAIMGCKKGAHVVTKDPGPATLAQGMTLIKSSDGSVSVGAPGGWKRGGPDALSAPTVGQALGTSENPMAENPLASSLGMSDPAEEARVAAELESKGILIWVNDAVKPIPGEERTHFSIKFEKDAGKSLEDAVADVRQDLLNESEPTYPELPIGKAARIQCKTVKVDGGELNQIIYVIVNGDDLYRVRFATQNGDGILGPIEEQVMPTLRIKPAAG